MVKQPGLNENLVVANFTTTVFRGEENNFRGNTVVTNQKIYIDIMKVKQKT